MSSIMSSIGSTLGLVDKSKEIQNIIEDNTVTNEIKDDNEDNSNVNSDNYEDNNDVNSDNHENDVNNDNYENDVNSDNNEKVPFFELSTIDTLSSVLGNTSYEIVRKSLYTYYGLITKEEETYPNLYMITYNKNNKYNKNKVEVTEEKKNIVSQYRGIIVEKNTNKPVCYTFSSMKRHLPDEITLENCNITYSYDGSQIKVFYDVSSKSWVVSTTRRIDSSKSFYFSNKSFYDMWKESITLDYEKLNKDYCYSFILQHPDNHVVARHSKPNVIHVLTRNMRTYKLVEENIGVSKPTTVSFTNKGEIWKSIKRLPFYKEGYVVKYNDMFVKLVNNKYQEVKELRGSSYSLLFHYFCLKKEHKIRKYLSYYPEVSETFSQYEKLFHNLCMIAYNEYIMVRVRKAIDIKNSLQFLKPVLYKLHGIHITKKYKITLRSVVKHFESYDPQLLKSLVDKSNQLSYSYN